MNNLRLRTTIAILGLTMGGSAFAQAPTPPGSPVPIPAPAPVAGHGARAGHAPPTPPSSSGSPRFTRNWALPRRRHRSGRRSRRRCVTTQQPRHNCSSSGQVQLPPCRQPITCIPTPSWRGPMPTIRRPWRRHSTACMPAYRQPRGRLPTRSSVSKPQCRGANSLAKPVRPVGRRVDDGGRAADEIGDEPAGQRAGGQADVTVAKGMHHIGTSRR